MSKKTVPGFPNGYALVVGIARYAQFGSLPAAVSNDALDFAKLLRDPSYCGYPQDQVCLLLDEAATKQAIIQGLRTLANKAKSTDTVIVFFSGHGARDNVGTKVANYVLPVDSVPGRLRTSALHSDEFSALLSNIRAQRLAVLLDACHAAGTGELKLPLVGSTLKFGLDDNAYQQLAVGVGRVIIASSRSDEVSWVRSGMRNSIFTHCLLEAMQGGSDIRSDGVIRVMDVFHDLTEKVPAIEPKQHPVIKARAENNFPLALSRGGKDAIVSRQEHSPQSEETSEEIWHRAEELAIRLYPYGPTDNAIWSRGGGDVSRLSLGMTGAAAWHDALDKLRHGGGGRGISFVNLVNAMRSDFPNNKALMDLYGDDDKPKSTSDTEVTKISFAIPSSSGQILRFIKITRRSAVGSASGFPLVISELPMTHQDLFAIKQGAQPARKRTVALFDRAEADRVLGSLRQANLQVRLPTYIEWQFAMAAHGKSRHTPQHTVPEGAPPTIDHWVRNEWEIGRPPASICEWIAEENSLSSRLTAPVGLIKVRGGAVSYASATRSIHNRFPIRLVVESASNAKESASSLRT